MTGGVIMEKKRLDENTIQVIIDQDDLDERGITMLDLLGNQRQIEDFFYSILSEVDTEHEFKNNDSVTFQALPIKDGLELIISKNTNKRDACSGMSSISKMIADQLKEHDSKTFDDDHQHSVINDSNVKDEVSDVFVIKFENFEDFISLANVLDDDTLTSDLFLYHHKYYLVVHDLNGNNYSSDSILNYEAIASEYGKLVKTSPSLLAEHGKKIMSQSALDTARYYFK